MIAVTWIHSTCLYNASKQPAIFSTPFKPSKNSYHIAYYRANYWTDRLPVNWIIRKA